MMPCMSPSRGANGASLGGQPLYRSMAEQFASGQMLHLDHKLREAPLNIVHTLERSTRCG